MFDVWVRGKFRRCRSGHFYPENTIKVPLYFFTQVLNTRQDLEVVSACLRNASGELSFLEEGVTAMQLRVKQTGRPSCPNSRTLCRQKIMGKQQTTNLSVKNFMSEGSYTYQLFGKESAKSYLHILMGLCANTL